jgi:hypothetical protein
MRAAWSASRRVWCRRTGRRESFACSIKDHWSPARNGDCCTVCARVQAQNAQSGGVASPGPVGDRRSLRVGGLWKAWSGAPTWDPRSCPCSCRSVSARHSGEFLRRGGRQFSRIVANSKRNTAVCHFNSAALAFARSGLRHGPDRET